MLRDRDMVLVSTKNLSILVSQAPIIYSYNMVYINRSKRVVK